MSALAQRSRIFDSHFLRLLAWLNGLVPCLLLAWDAWHGQLGANAVNDAIRTTGLLSLVMLLLSLSVTPLCRVTGWNELIAIRRPFGVWAFLYAVVHFSIYFGLDRELSVSSTLQEILARRFLLVGLVGVTLMLPLAVTSTDAATRRLGAKRWKTLHRLAYLAAAAGVLHYFMLVKSDVRQPLFFAGGLGLLLAARVVWPAKSRRRSTIASGQARQLSQPVAFWKGELTVLQTRQETHDVKTFRLGLPDGGELPFRHRPGQYLNIKLDTGERRIGRCYTIASSPAERAWCEITVKRDPRGAASRWLHDHVQEGDRVAIGAAAGRFVFAGDAANGSPVSHVVLIAGGVGITPVMAMTRSLAAEGWQGRIDLLIAQRSEADIIFADELAQLEQTCPGLTVRITLSQPKSDAWSGSRGRLSSEKLAEWVPDLAASDAPVFLCGPNAMMAAVTKQLTTLGVATERIHTEAFAATGRKPTDSVDASAASLPTVTFSRSAREATVHRDQSLLEAAEDAGVDLPFECRSGICGQCRVGLLAGRVEMATDEPLTADEKDQGVILACQARAITDVIVDA